MNGILISDRPQWVKLILDGKKKAEVRRGSAIYKAIKYHEDIIYYLEGLL